MATEPTLRHLFTAKPESSIDLAAVVRRSRARRMPKVLGITGVGVLAIGGIVFSGLQLGGGDSPASDTAGASTAETFDLPSDSAMSESDSIKRAPAEKLNLCAGFLTQLDTVYTGLTLSVDFPDAAVGASSVEGTVTMTNTGEDAVTGHTGASPAITLSRDGLVIWHSNGTAIELAREVDLAPGESMQYAASFSPVVCGVEDDLGESFRDDLPAASAGQYEVSAVIDVMGEFDAVLVTGPATNVTLN